MVIKRYFLSTFPAALYSAVKNHLCNFSRKKHFREIFQIWKNCSGEDVVCTDFLTIFFGAEGPFVLIREQKQRQIASLS